MEVHDGKWVNSMTKTTPSLFHFNGGGKAHHLNMESKVWYKAQPTSSAEAAKVYDTQLLFGDKMRSFREICPNHIEDTTNGGRRGKGRGRGRRLLWSNDTGRG